MSGTAASAGLVHVVLPAGITEPGEGLVWLEGCVRAALGEA